MRRAGRRAVRGAVGVAMVVPALVVGAVDVAGADSAAAGARWEEVDVGVPPGFRQATPRDVNEKGVILVDAYVPETPGGVAVRSFTVDLAGRWTPLRPGVTVETPEGVTAINDHGTVIGWSRALSDDGRECPFLLAPGGAARCIDEAGAGAVARITQASDVNDAGMVVGIGSRRQADGTLGGTVPVAWTAERGARVLPLPAGDTWGAAEAANDRGQIVGTVGASPARDDGRAVVWSPPSYRPVELAADAAGTRAVAVNERGDILGTGTGPSGATETLVWSRGRRHARVIPSPFVNDIADDGAPVGVHASGDIWAAARFDPRTLEPELLATPDHVTQAFATAGEHIVGWTGPDPSAPPRVARFVRARPR